MASRIEIPLDEYNGLKGKIRKIEDTLVDMSQETSVYKEIIDTLKILIEDLEDESLFNRIFRWANVVAPLKKIINTIKK